jgi:prophage regulatory protein
MSQYQTRIEPHTKPSPLFLRLREVADRTAMGASTILAWEKSGKFPQAIRLSPGKRVWLSSDVDQWVHRLAAELKAANPKDIEKIECELASERPTE